MTLPVQQIGKQIFFWRGMMKLKQAISGGLVALALTVSLGANAGYIKGIESAVKVDAEGLNLNSERGQEILYSRLQKAAKKICGSNSVVETGSLQRAMGNKSCYQETLTKAVESTGNQGLRQIHKTS
jgi:UrcA family protein